MLQSATTLKLHGYQERAIEFWLRNPSTFCMIDLGMGKTAIALKGIERLKSSALVVGPLQPILNTWPEEIEKWTPNLSYSILHGKSKDIRFHRKVNIQLLNYEGLKWYFGKCLQHSSQLFKKIFVLDESSMCKDPNTIRFDLLNRLQPMFLPHRLLLSATPVGNHLKNLWTQSYLLDNGARLGESYSKFMTKYFVETGAPHYRTIVKPKTKKQLFTALSDLTVRLKADDYLDMPKLIFNDVVDVLPPRLQKEYVDFEEDFVYYFSDNEMAIGRSEKVMVNKLRQFISGALYLEDGGYREVHRKKIDMLEQLVDSLQGAPCLIGINFRFEYDLIRKILPQAPVVYGGVPLITRADIKANWNKGNIPALVCNPNSMGHGLNLQFGGHHVIWYSLPWSWEHYDQLNGRLNRQGQPSPVVNVHHIILKNTIDMTVRDVLQRREHTETSFLRAVAKGS